MYDGVSFFSGIGGFELGLHLAGLAPYVEISQFIECNPHAQRVLRKNFPGVPICDDVRTYNPEGLDGTKTIFYGGFPCQDISQAGKRRGIKEGTRSGLFFEFMRCVRVVRPRIIYLENVAALLARGGGMDIVLGELFQIGYDAEWSIVSAASVGAVHLRERVWIIAYPQCSTASVEEYRCGGQGWQSANTSKSAILRQEDGAVGSERRSAGDRIPSYSNSIGRNGSRSTQRQDGDLLHQEWNAPQDQQSGSQWERRVVPVCSTSPYPESGGRTAPWDKDSQEQSDPAPQCSGAEPTHSYSEGLQIRQCQSGGQATIGTIKRSHGCTNGQSQANSGVCGDDDGISSGMDDSRGRRPYLMRHADLQDWLPFATDTQKIPYRKERLEELGNAVVPHAAAVGWRRIGEILRLDITS